MSAPDKFCPTGYHRRPLAAFKVVADGKIHRDCILCEGIRAKRVAEIAAYESFAGVDIDAVHHTRGAVRAPNKPRSNDAKD